MIVKPSEFRVSADLALLKQGLLISNAIRSNPILDIGIDFGTGISCNEIEDDDEALNED